MGSAERRPEADDSGSGNDESQVATDGLEKTCFGRRFIVDSRYHEVVDVAAEQLILTGKKAVEVGIAGAAVAIDIGRDVAGMGARSGEAPPE